MDIKRVTDTEDKFAIILDEKEISVLKRVLMLDPHGSSFPMQIDISHHLQRLEYEESVRRMELAMLDQQISPPIQHSDLPDHTGWYAVPTPSGGINGLTVTSFTVDDTIQEVGDPVDVHSVSYYDPAERAH